MKRNKNHIVFLVAIVSLLVLSCHKEDALTASNIDEFGYHLPQGNHDFDKRILSYFDKYKTYVLYDFSSADAKWAVTYNDPYYTLIPADTNYINNQLDLLDSTFFRYYDDSVLLDYLPRRFFLCSSLMYFDKQVDGYMVPISSTTRNSFAGSYQSFAANWGSKRILNIKGTVDSATIFRGNINFSFIKFLDIKSQVKSADFFALASYSTAIPSTNSWASRYKVGFLPIGFTGSTVLSDANSDWYSYIQAAVTTPYSTLTNSTGITSKDNTLKGILTSVKDSSGLIRKKYDIITNFYKTKYNIDLQRIGNGDK